MGPSSFLFRCGRLPRYLSGSAGIPANTATGSQHHFPLTREGPISQVIHSVKDLRIGPLTGETVTIIPESHLFGFPFVLCQENIGNTVPDTQLATAPSTTWLLWNRREPFVGDGVWRAWLGSPKAGDMTINFLRSKLKPFLSQHRVSGNYQRKARRAQKLERCHRGLTRQTWMGQSL